MAATKTDRKLRSKRKSGTKLAVLGTAAATVAAVAFGPAPSAGADVDIQQEVYTAGPLLSLLPALGLDSISLPVGNFPPFGDLTLTLNFDSIAYDDLSIYTLINALPFSKRGILSSFYDRVLSTTGDTAGQFPFVAGSGVGTRNLIEAYRAQISSVNGDTLQGYTPFQPGPNGSTNQTNQVLTYLLNPLRPNGGIEARFAPFLNLFGVDTTLPAAGYNTSTGIRLNTATVDVTWAYQPTSDFPVTPNPFSLLNSAMAVLPTNLLGGFEVEGLDLTAAGTNIASVLGIPNRLSAGLAGIEEGQAFYGTVLGNDLPILEAMRLPARIINLIFGTDLPTPFADALQPAAKILVNIGYSDVLAPDELNECATGCEAGGTPMTWAELGYEAYDRTFLTSATPEPFLSVKPLTLEEKLQVPGDVLVALFEGFKDVFFSHSAAPEPDSDSAAPVVEASADTDATSTALPAVEDDLVADELVAPEPETAPDDAPSDESDSADDESDPSPLSDEAPSDETESSDETELTDETELADETDGSESPNDIGSGDTQSTDEPEADSSDSGADGDAGSSSDEATNTTDSGDTDSGSADSA